MTPAPCAQRVPAPGERVIAIITREIGRGDKFRSKS